MEVQSALADKGHHRAPSIPDLLIAATAELAQLTLIVHEFWGLGPYWGGEEIG